MKLRVPFALVFATLFLFAGSSRAQMSDGERKAAARAAYTEGVELQDKGKPADALSRFEAAQKLFDAPTHLLRIAQCQALTGKLVEASETYETLSRKNLAAGSPDAFVQAQDQGKTEVAALRPRIPSLRVTVKPEPSTLQNLQITVNDRQMPSELAGIARPVNPGSYRLSAQASGYATAAPVTLEVGEREQKSVELVLTASATPPPPPVVGSDPNAPPSAPPPYEQPKPKPAGPSSSGVLLGLRAGVFVPNGDVDKTTAFDKYASAGAGLGADAIGRFAKLFLLGGTIEFASLGGPDSSVIPSGVRADVTTRSTYYGILGGIIPNVDKITFIADVGLGIRSISQKRTLSSNAPVTDESYSGPELSLNAGLSFPAGSLRLAPKAGFAFGSFSSRECNIAAAAAPSTACGRYLGDVQSSGHAMFNVQLAIYYHLDLSKK